MATEYVPYWQKLRDPRWQKKRLEAMDADGWKCADCDGADLTLNVHHLYYEKGVDPWDYPLAALITLCESCHKIRHDIKEEQERIAGTLHPTYQKLLLGHAKILAYRATEATHSLNSEIEVHGAIFCALTPDDAAFRGIAKRIRLRCTTDDVADAARKFYRSKTGWEAFASADAGMAFNG